MCVCVCDGKEVCGKKGFWCLVFVPSITNSNSVVPMHFVCFYFRGVTVTVTVTVYTSKRRRGKLGRMKRKRIRTSKYN